MVFAKRAAWIVDFSDDDKLLQRIVAIESLYTSRGNGAGARRSVRAARVILHAHSIGISCLSGDSSARSKGVKDRSQRNRCNEWPKEYRWKSGCLCAPVNHRQIEMK